MAETILDEYKYTINPITNNATVTVEDKTKEYYNSFLNSVDISNVNYSVTSMNSCFEDCINLKSVMSIPSNIIRMDRAFYNCKLLSGSIHVYNIPESYIDIFTGTTKNIFIIPHSSSIKEAWEEIASEYVNVKVINEPIIDTYNKVINTVTIGGYEEEELEDKIISYQDLVFNNTVYVQENNEINLLLKELNWEHYVKDEESDLNNYFYFEIYDRTQTTQVGFKRDLYYFRSNSSADPVEVDYSKFENYVAPTFSYSFDKNTWIPYTLGDFISIGSGQQSYIIYFKGNNLDQWFDEYTETTTYEGSTVTHYFRVWTHAMIENDNVICSGNIMSLRYGDNFINNYLTIPCPNTFKGLFYNCIYLKEFDLLPSMYLQHHCYAQMFYGCTSLTKIPELPATTLSGYCYAGMFSGCSSVAESPVLPATTLAIGCYGSEILITGTNFLSWTYSKGMLAGTSITSTPALPATALSASCYDSMFENCLSLTVAPTLPATTMQNYCYARMFSSCISLTTPPALPSTILAEECYARMFSGCTSLVVAPTLPATTMKNYCYSGMFQNCTSLVVAPSLPATTLAEGCYGADALDFSGYHGGMFSGCTSLTTPPSLPATTLAQECYAYMFYECTSLTKIPKLPATNLPMYCYEDMFNYAIKANSTSSSPCTKAYRIPTSGTGSAVTKSLTSMFRNITNDDSFTPSINTTFYINVSSF